MKGRQLYKSIMLEAKKLMQLDYIDLAKTLSVNHLEKYYIERRGDRIDTYLQQNEGRTPANTKGSIIYNNLIKRFNLPESDMILEGMKVKIIDLKLPNPYNTDVICSIGKLPKEFKLDEFVDKKSMIKKLFIKPLVDTMEVIGINYKSSWG